MPPAEPGKGRLGALASDLLATNLELSRKSLVDRTWFCALISILAIINMFVLGIEADARCRRNCGKDDDSIWGLTDNFFTAVFVADIILAMCVMKPKRYFITDRGIGVRLDYFRTFDFILVTLRVIDVWFLGPAGTKTDMKVFSALRVIHLGRFAKQVQLVDGFRELWLIMAGMADTLLTVFWVAVLLILVIWVFAIAITILANDGTAASGYNFATFWSKDDYWGSVPASVLSLFQVLTKDKWSHNLVWPLIEANNSLIIFFVTFIAVANLALLNTIIGAVVESTLRSARENEEKEAKSRQRADTKLMASLERIFQEADTDGNGELDETELNAMMRDPKVKKAMNQLGIPMSDLALLFQNLDEDGQSRIKTDDFFRGCTRLRGPAMARDLQHVSVDMDRHVKTAGNHIRKMRSVNDDISDILDIIDAIETDIVKDPHDDKDPVIVARRRRQKQSRSAYLRSNKTGEADVRSDVESCHTSDTDSLPALAHAKTGQQRHSSLHTAGGGGGASILRNAARGKNRTAGSGFQPPPPPLPPHLREALGGQAEC